MTTWWREAKDFDDCSLWGWFYDEKEDLDMCLTFWQEDYAVEQVWAIREGIGLDVG